MRMFSNSFIQNKNNPYVHQQEDRETSFSSMHTLETLYHGGKEQIRDGYNNMDEPHRPVKSKKAKLRKAHPL